MFCKKGVLRNFAKFARKYLCQSLFFNKVAGPVAASVYIIDENYIPGDFDSKIKQKKRTKLIKRTIKT